jgi:hypothetical protein
MLIIGDSGLTVLRARRKRSYRFDYSSRIGIECSAARDIWITLSMLEWSKVVVVNVLLTAIALVLLDFALRLTPLGAAREMAGHPDGYYVADQELGATLARNYPSSRFALHGARHEVFTNELGCFDWPVRLEPNEPYIIAIGDSFTWGHTRLEAKWTNIIERETGVRVLKCGVPATGTEHQLRGLKRLVARLPHPPSLVIQLHDVTDFNDDFCFPSLTVLAGQRVPAFRRIRLSDGLREPFTKGQIERMRRRIERKRGYEPGGVTPRRDERGLEGFLAETSTLYNIYKIGRIALRRDRARSKIKSGARMAYLNDPIEFNLLLLDDEDYPFVASRLEAHIATLRATRDFVQGVGAHYALFHTNSFRLPPNRPLVRRLWAFFDGFASFLGAMPELPRHLFNPHWTAEGDARVAEVILDRLRARGILPPQRSHRPAAQ